MTSRGIRNRVLFSLAIALIIVWSFPVSALAQTAQSAQKTESPLAASVAVSTKIRCFFDPILFFLPTPAECLEGADEPQEISVDERKTEPQAETIIREVTKEVVREVPVYTNTVVQAPVSGQQISNGISRAELQASLSGLKQEILALLPSSSVRYVYSSAPTYYVNPGVASQDYVNEQINSAISNISWTVATSSWMMNGSTVFYNGGNVGIGTTTPEGQLHIADSVNSAQAFVTNHNPNNLASLEARSARSDGRNTYAQAIAYGESVSGTRFGLPRADMVSMVGSAANVVYGNAIGVNVASSNVVFVAGGAERMRLSGSGNLGIGTTTPSSPLHVAGSAAAPLTVERTNSSNNAYVSYRATGGASFNAGLGAGGYFAIGTAANLNGAGAMLSVAPSTGFVGIGTTTQSQALVASGTIQSTDLLGGATTLSTDANGNIIRTPSDSKLKADVQDIGGALDKVSRLRGVSYSWIDQERFGKDREIGFLAQELELVVPEVVKSGGEYKSVNYQSLVALLAEAIKELKGKVDKMATWFSDEGKLKVQDQVCADDVCLTKEEFKAMLLKNKNGGDPLTNVYLPGAGTVTQPESPGENTVDTATSTPEDNTDSDEIDENEEGEISIETPSQP